MQNVGLRLASGKIIRTAIIYIRVSTAREDMKSPEQQLEICLNYCRYKGITPIGLPVEDLDLSGRDFAKRKIANLIERIGNREADAIIVWEYSRFGRNMIGSLLHLRELEARGGELLSATQDIDTSTPAGGFARDQFLRLAQYQLDVIRAGWMTTHRHRREAGLAHTGQPRFGYRRCDQCRPHPELKHRYVCTANPKCGGLLVPDTELRGPALVTAYERYVDGDATYRIAKDAWAQGVTSIKGVRMQPNQWLVTMDSGFAAGLLRGRSDTSTPLTNSRPDSYDIWGDGIHEGLIPIGLWDAYVERRLRQAKSSTREITPKYRLSGLVRCGAIRPGHEESDNPQRCNSAMSVTGGSTELGRGARHFSCKRTELHASGKQVSRTAALVDADVLEWLRDNAKGEQSAQRYMEMAAEERQAADRLPSVRKELEAAEARKKRISEAYDGGLYSLEDAKMKTALVMQEIQDRRELIRALESKVGATIAPEKFQGIEALWTLAAPGEIRKALGKVIDHVRVDPPAAGVKQSSTCVVPAWAHPSVRLRLRDTA